MAKQQKSPAPEVAREIQGEFKLDEPVELSTGVRAIIRAVPNTLIDNVSARIEDPLPPKQFIESKGKEEVNYLDPTFLREVENTNKRRGRAVTEALIMFGVELVDGVPDPEEWMPRLQHLVKRGLLDLSDWDLEDEFDLEYVYKAFVAVAQKDVERIMVACGLLEETVAAAMDSFQRPETRLEDSEVPAAQ
jgi:hypothetical protein